MDHSRLLELITWLIDGARSADEPTETLSEACGRLVELGVPLWRVGIFVRTLHPEVFGRSFIWRLGGQVDTGSVEYGFQDSPAYRDSPISTVAQNGTAFRANPQLPEAERYPILIDMRAEGVTDYLALPLTFLDQQVHVSSWTTKAPGGFTDTQMRAIQSVIPAFARYAEIVALRRTASSLLDTYVGNSAGARILGGQIRRGHTDAMHAAIWLSDLRGFTPLSDRLPAETVVDILNHYFDCQVEAIREQGGEVLKFMGDGLLAVFPIPEQDGDQPQICERALAAARDARARVDQLKYTIDESVERFRFGVALHVGRLLYGNIGGGNRLDFTCIGPAVNLAARLEKIAARLGRTVIASEAFAGACDASDDGGGDHPWTDLGEFPIAGFSTSQRVFGLRDEGN